jgi:branched-chain amino acid transport system ATP-binding protein
MILQVQSIHTYYGLSYILQGISLDITEGEVVGFLGRNGAGKTTTLRSIMGLTPPRAGSILYKSDDITGLQPFVISQMGIAYIPGHRGIFSYLTAMENLQIVYNPKTRWSIDDVLQRFPKLVEVRGRQGRHLSGGEQQMLAIARALVMGPDLILLDEPSQGLAPLIIEFVLDTLKELKRERVSMLLVEQNVELAVELVDRVYVIDQGIIVFAGNPDELMQDTDVLSKYLGVGG